MGLLHLAHFHEMTKKYQARHLDSWLGSGSKSKVFEGAIQPQWKKLYQINLFETLKNSFEIDFETYEKLHKKNKMSVRTPQNEWILDRIETLIPNLLGARYYKWVD
jgi:hydroxymethylglutaryl-CoA synthase